MYVYTDLSGTVNHVKEKQVQLERINSTYQYSMNKNIKYSVYWYT